MTESSIDALNMSPSGAVQLAAACESNPSIWTRVLADAEVRRSLARVWAASDFVANSCVRDASLLAALVEARSLENALTEAALAAELRELAHDVQEDAALMQLLRKFRRRHLVRIAWRDIASHADLHETLTELSALADTCIRFAHERARAWLLARYGVPRAADGTEQTLVILAMGKLGGRELNFSSDVDLVYLYPDDGETDGRRPIENAEFFLRLAQRIGVLLTAPTVDGFVYRVDLRLRPFGDSGPVAVSFSAFEDYLQKHGRDWERYAYVKARPVVGEEHYEVLYRDLLRPFVYRRYLDFGVFESLREMKAMIAKEVERRELQNNVKLGPGGIREIEFIVQAFQLLRGGSDRRLQQRELMVVLPLLVGDRLLTRAAVADLLAAYRFLRRLENRLQEWNDEQTHRIPDESAARERLAISLSYQDWRSLHIDWEAHRQSVTRHFVQAVFGPSQNGREGRSSLVTLLENELVGADQQAELRQSGFQSPEAILARVALVRESGYYRRLDETGRRRLQELLPGLLRQVGKSTQPEVTFDRLIRILERIGGRTVYLALLNENAAALDRLVDLCAQSEFLANQIAAHPLLLDELINERSLDELPTRQTMEDELAERHRAIHGDDAERQVQMLREFQRASVFRIAVADLTRRLPLMKVSDRLTDLAELIVRECLALAWENIAARHGAPLCGDETDGLREASMIVVAYGKFGGIELGYGSDLDLVLLHDSADSVQHTAGPQEVDNSVFFQRVGQRFIHFLTIHSAAGRLYEVDSRLRPGGNRGLLVQSLGGFEDYQRREAWTWEHQSLLRTRAVAGPRSMCERFETLRIDLLRHAVRREALQEEVRKMRARMRTELTKAKAGEFDLKQDAGGIADLEFLVQYWVLLWADRHPELVIFSDNIRQLESLASGALVSQTRVDFLTSTYRLYRTRLHHLALDGGKHVIASGEFVEERQGVSAIWSEVMES